MRRRRLLWQIFPTYMMITLLAVAAVSWYVSAEVRDFFVRQDRTRLESMVRLVIPQLEGFLAPGREAQVDRLCKGLRSAAGARLTVIAADGRVLGDSDESPGVMDNHGDRPEVLAALRQGSGTATRYSHTSGVDMMYVALSVELAGGDRAVVRAAVAVTDIDRTLMLIHSRLWGFGLVVVVFSAFVGLVVSRRISLPLEALKQGAERFARGDLGVRLSVSGSSEIGTLAEAMNQMAGQLDERLRTVTRQGEEREAIFASMVEGVMALDSEGRIQRINGAASRLLGLGWRSAEGKSVEEAVRKADLLDFVKRTLGSKDAVEGDLVIRIEGAERYLQAHGTRLQGGSGQGAGALIVLNDVTRLRRLESLRRDFVANVSHELKTPVTAIRGAAETLSSGAMEDPVASARFLSIITKQAERLGAIIDDLLSLSRIEQEGEKGPPVLSLGPLRGALENAIQACELDARQKQIRINLFCSPELTALFNGHMIEQAVINLLTNAVKYSHSGGTIVVDAAQVQGRVMVKVQDWGRGISPEHLPRLFERFYRVDQARSRQLGGTGLGLAIVKHIAQSHGGEILVHSTPGQGSVFTLALPLG